MHNKSKSILITLLSIIIFTFGIFGILVWVVNTLSQNTTITTKLINSQIHRLLDLDSEVINPHAYIDWDLQYKIRADKLTFINNSQDLVSVEDLQLNIFIPYFAFRKIYITQMNGENLFVNFERYENNKLNIIEIFNITGFFKVYFKNSSISINKYFFKYTDKFHKPNETMYINGNNILLSKFTLKKYLQLIMDGEIIYNKQTTPFLINYNLKFPIDHKKYNLEINLPNIDIKTFENYIKEFDPNLNISAKGSIKAKISSSKFFNIDANLENIKFSSLKYPYKINFEEKLSIFSKFAYENKNFIIDELNLLAKDFDIESYGKIKDINSLPLNIKLNIKAKNSSGKSILKLLPKGIPVLNYAIDKAKDYQVDGKINGEVLAEGIIGNLLMNGQVKVDHVTLGYGEDLPKSKVELDFQGDKLYIDGTFYPNYNQNEFAKILGNIKITKPIFLDFKISSAYNVDLVSVKRALNIYSDIFNFPIGPVNDMEIKQGRGEINLEVEDTPPNVYLTGKMHFRDGIVGYEGLNGLVYNASGEINFAGNKIYYKNIKGEQDKITAYAHGETEIHKNGVTHFYLDIPMVPLTKAKYFVENSPLIAKIAEALTIIEDPKGLGELNMVLESDKTTIEPYIKGVVLIKEGSCNIKNLAYRVNNIKGKVDFDTFKANLDFTGIVNNVFAKLTGTVENNYSKIKIDTPKANIRAAYELIYNSPMFFQMRNSFDDFSNFEGYIKTSTQINGDFTTENINFYSDIDIINGKLRYLDIPEDVILTEGKIIAQTDKILFNQIKGTIFNVPFSLEGTITNIGQKEEQANIEFRVKNVEAKNIEKIKETKIIPPDVQKLLSNFEFQSGFIDITAFMHNEETKTLLNFKDLYSCYKASGEPVIIKSGEFFFSENILKMKNLAVQMIGSNFLLDGDISNYKTNPYYNINLTSNVSEKDFNDTLVPIFNLPLTLAGKIYTNINFRGSINNWQVKMRAMLDDASYILYKGANIGEGLSRFMFFDISGKEDDITINTLDVFSPNTNNEFQQPRIIAQIYGKIKDLGTDYPYIENLEVKLNDYTNISFLNILFYDPSKSTPLLQNGHIKGEVLLNGKTNELSILGHAEVKDAIIPSTNTTIEKMNVNFRKDLIEINNAEVNIAGSKANINAILDNKITIPVVVKNLDLKSENVNSDKIMQSFTGLFSTNTADENIIGMPLPPVIIENGTVDIKEFIYNGLPANNFKANFKVTPDWFCVIKDITAQITEGNLAGDIIYSFYTTDLTGNIAVEKVMANAFATTFLNLPNEIHGDMDANVKFSTRGKTHNQIVENLNGMAYFKLYNGRMLRLGSIEYMLRIANTFKGGLTRLNLNAIVNLVAPKTGYFDTIEGDVQIQDGIILTDKITSRSSELNLFLTGSYNMNNAIVNATIIGQMPMESKESILWLGPLGKISFNSLVKQLTKEASKENENQFFYSPLSYLNTIPGLNTQKGDYRFFVVSLKGNLYTDKYVDDFKWIK